VRSLLHCSLQQLEPVSQGSQVSLRVQQDLSGGSVIAIVVVQQMTWLRTVLVLSLVKARFYQPLCLVCSE
jgi:hypothetical protein